MEFVYVVKRFELFDLSFPHGFVGHGNDDRVDAWTSRIRERGFFLERRQAERDSSFKQIIPYVMVCHADEVLLLRRLDTGGESRLHGKLSIGVGGHINPVDEDGRDADVVSLGCRRELEEELILDDTPRLSTVGVINDESQDVGSVHFGLVMVAHCATRDVAIRETHQLEGEFVTRHALEELAARERGRFETWSALIIDHLDEALQRAP